MKNKVDFFKNWTKQACLELHSLEFTFFHYIVQNCRVRRCQMVLEVIWSFLSASLVKYKQVVNKGPKWRDPVGVDIMKFDHECSDSK